MYIINGRLRGDSYSRYTYSSHFGSSTVDYFLPDLNPNSLRAFTVSQLNPLSDHSKITLYLTRAMPNQEASNQTQFHSLRNTYRWKQNSKDTYISTIVQTKIQVLLDQFRTTPFPHNSEGTNLAVDKLNRIFEVSATLSNLKTTKIKAKRPHASEKWFDNDCKRLRKEVRILSNQKHRDADNENILHLYHEKLKQYRNTLRKKKVIIEYRSGCAIYFLKVYQGLTIKTVRWHEGRSDLSLARSGHCRWSLNCIICMRF